MLRVSRTAIPVAISPAIRATPMSLVRIESAAALARSISSSRLRGLAAGEQLGVGDRTVEDRADPHRGVLLPSGVRREKGRPGALEVELPVASQAPQRRLRVASVRCLSQRPLGAEQSLVDRRDQRPGEPRSQLLPTRLVLDQRVFQGQDLGVLQRTTKIDGERRAAERAVMEVSDVAVDQPHPQRGHHRQPRDRQPQQAHEQTESAPDRQPAGGRDASTPVGAAGAVPR